MMSSGKKLSTVLMVSSINYLEGSVVSSTSCLGLCGNYIHGKSCQCDITCKNTNDCCNDFVELCEGPAPILEDDGKGLHDKDEKMISEERQEVYITKRKNDVEQPRNDSETLIQGPSLFHGSCVGHCFQFSPSDKCQCDATCIENGDCCDDFKSACTDTKVKFLAKKDTPVTERALQEREETIKGCHEFLLEELCDVNRCKWDGRDCSALCTKIQLGSRALESCPIVAAFDRERCPEVTPRHQCTNERCCIGTSCAGQDSCGDSSLVCSGGRNCDDRQFESYGCTCKTKLRKGDSCDLLNYNRCEEPLRCVRDWRQKSHVRSQCTNASASGCTCQHIEIYAPMFADDDTPKPKKHIKVIAKWLPNIKDEAALARSLSFVRVQTSNGKTVDSVPINASYVPLDLALEDEIDGDDDLQIQIGIWEKLNDQEILRNFILPIEVDGMADEWVGDLPLYNAPNGILDWQGVISIEFLKNLMH